MAGIRTERQIEPGNSGITPQRAEIPSPCRVSSEADQGKVGQVCGVNVLLNPASQRRTVNLKLLRWSVAFLVAAGAACYWWHGNRTTISVDTLILRAKELGEDEGQWGVAAGYLEEAVSLRPDDKDARLLMADYYVHAAVDEPSRKRAIRVLVGTLDRYPDQTKLRVDLARLLYETGAYTQAHRQVRGSFVDVLESASKEARSRDEVNQKQVEEFHSALRSWALSHFRRVDFGDRRSRADYGPYNLSDAAGERSVLEASFPNDGVVATSHAGQGKAVAAVAALHVLENAFRSNPADAQIASACAELYFRFADELRHPEFDPLERADVIIDSLVQSAPSNPAAWVARYQYRKLRGERDAVDDLNRAIEADDNSTDALYLRGLELTDSGRPEDLELALRDFERLLKAVPRFEAGHLALARLHEVRGASNDVVAALESAANLLGNRSIPIGFRIAEVHLAAGRLQLARQALDQVSTLIRDQSPTLDIERRIELEGRLGLVSAGIELANGIPSKAIPELKAIVVSASSRSQEKWAKEVLRRAHVLLADAWMRLDAPEMAADHWMRVGEVSNDACEAMLHAAAQFEAASRYADAMNAYERALQLDGVGASAEVAKVGLLRAELGAQLMRPASQRSWGRFADSLRKMQDEVAGSWEPLILEVEYWLAQNSRDGNDKAIQVLENSAAVHKESAAFWAAAARLYARLGDRNALESAIAACKEAGGTQIDVALLKSESLVRIGRAQEATATLIEALDEASSASQQREIQLYRIRLTMAQGKAANALAIIKELLTERPLDPQILSLACEVALSANELDECKRWEEELRKLTGPTGLPWRQRRVERLLKQFQALNPLEISELNALVEEVRLARPQSRETLVMAGRLAELTGDGDRAIRLLGSAIDLGERRIEVVELYVRLLFDNQEFVKAGEVLELVIPTASSDSLHELARHVEIERAREDFNRNPDDIDHGLRYANLLLQADRLKDAEQEFRKLANRIPTEPRGWSGLFTALVRLGRQDDARQALRQLVDNVDIESSAKEYLQGQCYELLGERNLARVHFQHAVKARPEQSSYRNHLAKLLLSMDLTAAERHYEEILRQDADNVDARRQLAVIYATMGHKDWSLVEMLLGSRDDAKGSGTAADARLKALLLSRRGKNRRERVENCKHALRILEDLIHNSPIQANDTDRIALAGLCDQLVELDERLPPDEKWTYLERARIELRVLLDRSDPPPLYVLANAEFLLRHGAPSDSATGVDSDASELDSANDLRSQYLQEAQDLVEALTTRLKSSQGIVPLPVMSLRLRLLRLEDADVETALATYATSFVEAAVTDSEKATASEAVGQLAASFELHELSEKYYRQIADISDRGRLLHARSLAAQGNLRAALLLCVGVASQGNVEAALVMAQLFGSFEFTDQQYRTAKLAMDELLECNPVDVQLLTALGVMASQGDSTREAVEMFRRIVEIAPDNVVARNNLATLLAELPEGRDEALQNIRHAIAIAGPTPALLDTQGTIYLFAGHLEEAVASLEEATAGVVDDSRILLHLAAAYDASHRSDAAMRTLAEALGRGVPKAMLTSKDRELLAQLQHRYNRADSF